MRISFVIDGFNLYGSIVDLERRQGLKVKWLDVKGLLSSYLYAYGKNASIESIHYFTALQHYSTKYDPDCPNHHDPDKVNRHRTYIKCLENTGVNVHYGRFKRKWIRCPDCKSSFIKWEEKETDVSLGIQLFDIAIENAADTIILVTGDTDLVPAVKLCQHHFPHIKIGFCFPFNRKQKELWNLSTVSDINIKGKQYAKYQFTDPYIFSDGKSISKPKSW